MDGYVLSCDHLFKSYNSSFYVLNDLTIKIPAGKVVGILGPNGCGKTTLLKLVSGILVPDSGDIVICGQQRSDDTNQFVSYLPERPYFSPSMTVEQLITYFSDFYADFDADRARGMLYDLGINPSSKLRTLSKGNKEKVQLILVMSRRSPLYMLDEPIGGVDPASRDYILQTIINNRTPDSSMIITTHLIADIEPVIDEFVFLGYGGQVLMCGSADQARRESGKSIDELFREVFRCSRSC